MTPVNRLGMESRRLTKAGAKLVTISSHELLTKSNYQDAGRYIEADLADAGRRRSVAAGARSRPADG